ncbi:hypothetical protein appser6_21840, partial [Actinobacillus pleuropneumoniae serovar 6 str. Femo]
ISLKNRPLVGDASGLFFYFFTNNLSPTAANIAPI